MKNAQSAVLESLSVVEKRELQKLANECKNFTKSDDVSTKLFPVNPSEYNDTCIFLLVIKDILNVNKRDGKTQMAFTANNLQTVRNLIYNS